MREHLHVDASLIHLPDAQGAKIMQALKKILGAGSFRTGEMGDQFGIPVMLFERDDRNLCRGRHVVSISWESCWGRPLYHDGRSCEDLKRRGVNMASHGTEGWMAWKRRKGVAGMSTGPMP